MEVQGQCSISESVTITDKDTTIISFLIEGSQVDDLSVNGVCGVHINFVHDFLGDVSIILVSPSGQEVQLIGPSLQTSPNTQFVRWNVNFIPCAFSPNPDPGIAPVWYNINNWFQFTTYTGSYYPQLGCLEDLNSGPVNGSWSFKIIDAVDFGAGIIDEMSIVFCDPTGIDCAPCNADPGSFSETRYDFCEGMEELRIIPEITYPGPSPDPDEYIYKYAIINGNSSSIADSIDLRNSPPGVYEICGMSVNALQENSIPSIQGMLSKSEYEEALQSSLLCASLSQECIMVTIQDVRDTILVEEVICSGDSYQIDGQSFSDAGTYIVNYKGPSCDTMTILNLEVFTLEGQITGQDDSLTCTGNNVLLNGNGSISDDTIDYRWFTVDGFIRTDTLMSSVLVSQVGRYFLEVTSGFCKDTVFADIEADNSFIELDFDFDTLNCINESSLINLTASQSLSNVRWDGPAAFSRVGDDIVVSDPGTYLVTVTSVDGCTSTDSVEIIDGSDIEDPLFTTPDISCVQPEVTPGVSLNDTSTLFFSWIGPDGFTSDILNPVIDEPGDYVLSITGRNGCVENWDINVADSRVYSELTTYGDTLDCSNQTVEIGVASSISNVSYSWTGPNGITSDQSEFTIDQEGNYMVSVTTTDQCVTTAPLLVEKDVRLPSLVLNDLTINCADDGSTSLDAMTDAFNPVYNWTGPGGYVGFGQNPDAGVIGVYTVTVRGSNGCDRTKSLTLQPGDDVPDVDFSSEIINCDDPLRSIIPSDSLGLSFQFLSPTDISFNDVSPLTGEPGEYRIRVTDSVGCYSDFIHEVRSDTLIPMIALSSLELNCNNDSVQIRLTHDIPLRETLWTGPSGFNSDIDMPYTDIPGKYILNVTGTNGCSNVDSINVTENYNLPQITPVNSNFTCITSEVSISVGVDMNPSTFEWIGPAGFNSLDDRPLAIESGNYYVTVTGPNGCKNQDSLIVGYDTIVPIVTLTNDGILTCPDPVVTLSGTSTESNVNTIWIGPDTIINGSLLIDVEIPGLWILEVIDTAGCIGRATDVVNSEIDYPNISVDYNDIDCNLIFSNIEVTAGPLSEHLFWQGPEAIADDVTNFNTQKEGDYSIFATGLNGCDTVVTFSILKDTIPPEFNLNVSDTITCSIPSVTIETEILGDTPIGTYNWIGPNAYASDEPIPSISHGGRYILQAFGVNGCVSIDTVNASIDTIAPFVQGIGNEITCKASKATLDVLTNVLNPEYNWEGPNNFTSSQKEPIVVTPGEYSVTITGENGCFSSDLVMLSEDKVPPLIIIDPVSYLFCDSTGINLEVSSDDLETTFIWFGEDFFSSDQRPFVEDEGSYVVFATGLNGCRSQDSTQVVVDTRLPQFGISKSNIDCVEDMGAIEAHGLEDDLSWQWVGPSGFTSTQTSISVADSGTYMLTVQGTNLCIDTQAVLIEIDRVIPQAIASFDEILQCEVTQVYLNGGGSTGRHDLTYSWITSNGNIISGEDSPFPLVDKAGDYSLIVVDNVNKCFADTTIFVVRTEQEFNDFVVLTSDPSCIDFVNGEISFLDKVGGYDPILLSLDGGPLTARNSFKFLDAGTYTITAKDSLGCITSKEVTLYPPRDNTIDLGEDRLLELGESTELVIETNVPEDSIFQLIWNDTTGLECLDCLIQTINPKRTTLYNVTLIDVNGCRVETEVLINVAEDFEIDFPNIIKPGSGNGNDIFYISQTRGIKNVNYLSIYDRWGDRMFHAENFITGDNSIGWDGMFLGKPALPAVYVVIAELLLENGDTILVKSDLAVIR